MGHTVSTQVFIGCMRKATVHEPESESEGSSPSEFLPPGSCP